MGKLSSQDSQRHPAPCNADSSDIPLSRPQDFYIGCLLGILRTRGPIQSTADILECLQLCQFLKRA